MNKTQYLENIAMAVATLRGHKVRSFLTILGVIIGVLTVIVISSILTGMRQNLISMVEEYGTENIYAFHLTTGPRFGPISRSEWMRKPLRPEDAAALMAGSAAIQDVSWEGLAFRIRGRVTYKNESYSSGELRGVPSNYASLMNMGIAEGRFYTEAEDASRSQVCVLGKSVVEALFPNQESITGKQVRITGQPFTVLGVLDKRKGGIMGQSEEDNMILIPYRTLRKMSPRSDWIILVIKAREGQLAKALNDTEVILRRQRGLRFNQDNDFDVTTADKITSEFDAMTAQVGIIAIAISGVGLLVGGIGVMNIMLVSVTERTREIGVRKAVGAKRQDITFQFLFEAITLTTIGGIIGIVLAIAVSYLVIWLVPDLPATIPIWAVVTGFLVSVAIGLIFGVWPAVKAARLDPIECLHYE